MAGSITSLGLGSTLDLQGILDGLRKADEAAITKIQNEKTEMEAQKNEFNSINAKFLSMKSDALNLSLSSNYLKRNSSISNTDALGAVISDGADLGTHSVNITRLATKSSFMSAGMSAETLSVVTPTSQKSSTGFADPNNQLLAPNEVITVTYGTGDNLRVLTLDAGPSGMSLNRVASEFKNIPENDAGNGDNYVDATVTQGEDGQYYLEFTPSNGGTGSENRIMVTQPPDATAFESSASNATFSYSVGSGSPVSIDVPTDTTLSGLAELINSTPNNGGVTASIINTGSGDSPYKLVLKASDTGEASRITIHSQLDGLPMTQENGDGYIMAADNALDFTNPITIRMVDNNTNFVFSEDTGNGFQAPITAKIADGVYQNGEDLAAAVETALEQASAQSGAGADYSVQYNTGTQKLEISQHGTLDGVAINWSDPTSTAANALGFTNDATITPKTSSLNSAFALDGIDYQREDNTGLTDVIDGVNFTLAGIGTSNISITENTSGIITEIKEMINTLNELAKEIDANDDYNKETGEWGTLAKTPSIGNAKERLLSLVGSQLHVDGSSITSFYDMGLEVSRDGSITLDESILTQKVNGSFTDVEKFFLGNDSITGMADQINDMLKEFTKAQGLMQSETQAVDTKITQMTEDITSKTEQIEKKYETMAAQFTELDKYMRQMQSQQNFITQMTEAQKNSNK